MHQPHAETLAWRHGVVRPGQARGEREGIVWTHLQNYTQFSSRLSHWRRYVNNSTVVVMVCRGLWITSSPQSAYCVRHCLYVTSKWRTIVITVVSVLMSNTSVNSRRQPPPPTPRPLPRGGTVNDLFPSTYLFSLTALHRDVALRCHTSFNPNQSKDLIRDRGS